MLPPPSLAASFGCSLFLTMLFPTLPRSQSSPKTRGVGGYPFHAAIPSFDAVVPYILVSDGARVQRPDRTIQVVVSGPHARSLLLVVVPGRRCECRSKLLLQVAVVSVDPNCRSRSPS